MTAILTAIVISACLSWMVAGLLSLVVLAVAAARAPEMNEPDERSWPEICDELNHISMVQIGQESEE